MDIVNIVATVIGYIISQKRYCINLVSKNCKNKSFEDVVVKITSCPQLTKEPFNLAANGLHGNTAIIRCDSKTTQRKWNMNYFLQNFPYDSFLIGGGFGAKPNLPSNGYLIMNATFSRPEQINNASRLAYVRSLTDSGIVEIMKEPDQMTCCTIGNFFMSEGRPGPVLEVQAKKRKSPRPNIISIIGKILYSYYGVKNKLVGLGGVLLINKGEMLVSVISNKIPENQIISSNDLLNRVEHRAINCTSNITAFGTILGSKATFWDKLYPRHCFYTFSENNVGGRFAKDVTPDETEYVGYFNTAEYLYHLTS
ncbi:ester hydrolase C11orf54-like isoform X2 [Linepithema humile]|uniref:ester hydrolase C11orf54-like isoform X2 n=1 Tax=Linepithema humile TaxID=83485 RepID=UPI00351DDA00